MCNWQEEGVGKDKRSEDWVLGHMGGMYRVSWEQRRRRESFTEKQMLELSEIWVLGRLVEQTGGERKANAETTGEGEPGVGPVEGWDGDSLNSSDSDLQGLWLFTWNEKLNQMAVYKKLPFMRKIIFIFFQKNLLLLSVVAWNLWWKPPWETVSESLWSALVTLLQK